MCHPKKLKKKECNTSILKHDIKSDKFKISNKPLKNNKHLILLGKLNKKIFPRKNKYNGFFIACPNNKNNSILLIYKHYVNQKLKSLSFKLAK